VNCGGVTRVDTSAAAARVAQAHDVCITTSQGAGGAGGGLRRCGRWWWYSHKRGHRPESQLYSVVFVVGVLAR
jgi:hypothetical protein